MLAGGMRGMEQSGLKREGIKRDRREKEENAIEGRERKAGLKGDRQRHRREGEAWEDAELMTGKTVSSRLDRR